MSPTIIDYSLPLSEVVKEETKPVHDLLEKHEGVRLLVSGSLSREDYILYLMMLWHIYDTLEQSLEQHAQHPALESTYNPTLLARTAAIADDITVLTDSPTWQSSALFTSLTRSPPQTLKAYLERIRELAHSEPARLLAHSYVRYLGDLSGGQTIRRNIAKAYGLNEAPGSSGLQLYDFKELQAGSSSKLAGLGEMKRIKDWFRSGMNSAAKDNIPLKELIVDEAHRAYSLNADLLAFLATTPEEDDPNDPEHTIHRMTVEPKKSFWTYSTTSFAVFILAASIAHFVLIVGGFTGTRGYDKLMAVEAWVANLLTFGAK